jgi:ribonuclease Z
MQVVLLGTGCPVAHAERFGPATLVRHGETAVLVDCGSGVTQRLVAAGTPGRDIDAVLLTHLHSDHLVDLFQLVVSSWHQGRPRPLAVYGPPGTAAHVRGVMDLWGDELSLRIAHEKRPSTAALSIEVTELDPLGSVSIGSLEIGVIPVDHRPVRHAYGFAFEAGGLRLVISGDTRPCETLAVASRDAHLLVHEVFVHGALPIVPGVRSAETVAAVASYHSAPAEVAMLAERANVGCLALTHFVPPDIDRRALLAEISPIYRGPVLLGEDLMTIDVAAQTVSWRGALIGLGAAFSP